MKKKYISLLLFALLLFPLLAEAQSRALVNTSKSANATLWGTNIDDVSWTGGFWKERFDVCRDTMVLSMWNTLSKTTSAYNNFLVASGDRQGRHSGPQFFDGDFYKWFEGMASVYAITKNPSYDKMMDEIIDKIARSQRADGYIHTPVIISQKGSKSKGSATEGPIGTATGSGDDGAFVNRLNFETYNLGHLMTAACVHYRATGKRSMLDVAIKAADFLCKYYETASAELARNAICPSHYMGVMEMYRTTGDKRYMELAQNLIEIRGLVENGTDDNQDRIPFREQKTAMGHAVRANYLYAGVADVVAETGDASLMSNLESIWKDITTRKMYITGACGALYDGTSPDGTSYEPDHIQKVHQSYGRAFQLPNSTAHNETCANIGNMLFNYRMFAITGEAKYNDIVETVIYNSLLPGVSLDGKRYFYTNPLRVSKDFPYTLRWPKERTENISCFCCPPNTMRTICEVQDYAYSISEDGLWVNLYSSNILETSLSNGSTINIKQESDYPWNGDVNLSVVNTSAKEAFTMHFYIPEWAEGARISVNGELAVPRPKAGSYATVNRVWKGGDTIFIHLPMETRLMQANPLAEEVRGQIAVKRGPIVYCLESCDISDENGCGIDDIVIPSDTRFEEEMFSIDGSRVLSLTATVLKKKNNQSWEGTLYRPVNTSLETVKIRLIPYYAWGNREKCDMSVWLDSGSPAGLSVQTIDVYPGKYSLHEALRNARNMRRTGAVSKDNQIALVLHEGVYSLTEPLAIRPEDSGTEDKPLIIKSASGEKVVISGGMNIAGWKKSKGKVWEADVPQFNGNDFDFRQVWVNGRKAVRARDVDDFEKMNRILSVDKENEILYVPAEAVSKIAGKASGAEMVLHQMWAISNLRIKSIDIEGSRAAVRFHDPESRIQFERPWPSPMTKAGRESPFYIQGAKALLDKAGEWWFDSQNRKLFYYPLEGEDMATAEVIVPVLETLIDVQGTLDRPTSNICFEGIEFSHSTWMRPSTHGHVPLQAGMYLTDGYKLRPSGVPGNIMTGLENQAFTGRPASAVLITGANNVSFSGCRFTQLASCGLDYKWATDGGKVEGCVFTDIGGNAIQVGELSPDSFENHLPYNPSDKREVCNGLTISNNYIHHIGLEDWGCVAICAGFVSRINITHNEISFVPYSGISLGWGWTRGLSCMHDNSVTANHIHDYAGHLYDTACIYTLSAQPRTVITRNWCHSIQKPSYVHDPNHWFYLYTDEGSSYIDVKNNVCEGEKFLRNSNGPGVTFVDNGPDIKDAEKIKAEAGLEEKFKNILTQ